MAESIDFGLDQLDTKKKIRPKLGEGIAMRLRFVPSAAQLDGSGATGTGYALVTSDGDAGANLGATGSTGSAGEGVELTAGVKSSAVASSAAMSSAAASASTGSGKKATPMKTETATTTPSSSAKKGKKTEAAFTSLASGNKGDDTCVNL